MSFEIHGSPTNFGQTPVERLEPSIGQSVLNETDKQADILLSIENSTTFEAVGQPQEKEAESPHEKKSESTPAGPSLSDSGTIARYRTESFLLGNGNISDEFQTKSAHQSDAVDDQGEANRARRLTFKARSLIGGGALNLARGVAGLSGGALLMLFIVPAPAGILAAIEGFKDVRKGIYQLIAAKFAQVNQDVEKKGAKILVQNFINNLDNDKAIYYPDRKKILKILEKEDVDEGDYVRALRKYHLIKQKPYYQEKVKIQNDPLLSDREKNFLINRVIDTDQRYKQILQLKSDRDITADDRTILLDRLLSGDNSLQVKRDYLVLKIKAESEDSNAAKNDVANKIFDYQDRLVLLGLAKPEPVTEESLEKFEQAYEKMRYEPQRLYKELINVITAIEDDVSLSQEQKNQLLASYYKVSPGGKMYAMATPKDKIKRNEIDKLKFEYDKMVGRNDGERLVLAPSDNEAIVLGLDVRESNLKQKILLGLLKIEKLLL